MSQKNDQIDDIVRQVIRRFSQYLEQNNNRKTHERFAILEEIYRNQKHFDAETLYVQMKKSAYRVSRATVYNTLEVLLDCGLIKKHHFGNNVSFYEKTHGFPEHYHIICSNCNSIQEFEEPSIEGLAQEHSQSKNFQLYELSLNLYGLCKECRKD